MPSLFIGDDWQAVDFSPAAAPKWLDDLALAMAKVERSQVPSAADLERLAELLGPGDRLRRKGERLSHLS